MISRNPNPTECSHLDDIITHFRHTNKKLYHVYIHPMGVLFPRATLNVSNGSWNRDRQSLPFPLSAGAELSTLSTLHHLKHNTMFKLVTFLFALTSTVSANYGSFKCIVRTPRLYSQSPVRKTSPSILEN
jgi:hypothetical protein